jgi:hypothetical protein
MATHGPVTRGLDPVLGLLDWLRWWGLVGLGPVARWLIPRREARVTVYGLITVAAALLGVLFVPWWWLLWTPLLLGVPHLVADLRYLVARPGWGRAPTAVLLLLPLLAWAGGGAWVSGLVLMGLGVVGRGAERWALLILGAAGIALTMLVGPVADLGLAHAHNGVALVLWWVWRPRPRHAALVPLAAVLGAVAVASVPAGWWAAASTPEGVSPLEYLARLAPGLGPTVGLKVVAVFAFAQAVHYGVWLRLMPEDDRARPTPRTFRMSLRALEADVGSVPLAVAVGLAVGFPVWALAAPGAAADGYLSFAGFHAHLELGAVALLLTRGRP